MASSDRIVIFWFPKAAFVRSITWNRMLLSTLMNVPEASIFLLVPRASGQTAAMS
jgi:hypothetical protein